MLFARHVNIHGLSTFGNLTELFSNMYKSWQHIWKRRVLELSVKKIDIKLKHYSICKSICPYFSSSNIIFCWVTYDHQCCLFVTQNNVKKYHFWKFKNCMQLLLQLWKNGQKLWDKLLPFDIGKSAYTYMYQLSECKF